MYACNRPKSEGPPTTPMNNIEITKSGITKLLSELNVDKTPDLMSSQIYSSKMLPERYVFF